MTAPDGRHVKMEKNGDSPIKGKLTFRLILASFALGVALVSAQARADVEAQESKSADEEKADVQANGLETEKTSVRSTPQTKAPYALPWQLRSVIPANSARLDSATAFYDDKNGNSGGVANASMLGGSYKLIPNLAVSLRLGFVANNPPAGAPGGTSLINPLLGGLYSIELSHDFRAAFFLGMTAPIGMGGGNSPSPNIQAANSAGILARSAMDNALFAVNYFTVIPGVDLAYIAHGWTLQIEATVLQLTRVRGEQIDKDPSRTNFTSGLEVGYAVWPEFFLQGELRYQRWLENATASASAKPAIENLSFAIGPRFSFKAGSLTLKPGVAYVQGISGPIAQGGYTYPTNSDRIIFLDFPVTF
jgi:hypothetical protein